VNSTPPHEPDVVPSIDTGVPHSARVWNYWLGGKDNFAIDREVGDQVRKDYPPIVDDALASRAFLGRVVRFLAGDAGIRQFLDLGTGLPAVNATHEVAQLIDPACRIVYVDNDPLVLVHARALLTSHTGGPIDYIDADVREPAPILERASKTLDFSKPIAVLMLGILGNITNYDETRVIVQTIIDAVASGSCLVINDGLSTPARDAATDRAAQHGPRYTNRTLEQVTAYFDGLQLLEPGVVSTPMWRPAPGVDAQPLDLLCGVGRKP
jgi:hypothetical protein